MSQNLRKYLPLFEHIAAIKLARDRKIVIAIFAKDKNFIKALEEIAINTVEGNIELTKPQKKRLRKHKELLVLLSERRGRKLLSQSGGGFFTILIPLVKELLEYAINGED